MTGREARLALAAAVCACIAGALSIPGGAGAQSTSYGANLSKTANASFGCQFIPPFGFPGANTCTYVGTSATGESTATPFPGGIVTRARVKTSQPTGPMRFTVVRAISGVTAGFACCFYAGQSQVFTPQANATTAVNVRLPVVNEINPTSGQTVDYIGISVLNPNTAIPANGPQELNGSLGFYPHIGPADTEGRIDGNGTDAQPLVNVDFTPLCGGLTRAQRATNAKLVRRAERERKFAIESQVPTAHASGGAGCLNGVSIGGGSRQGSKAILALACNLSQACSGQVSLTTGGGKARATKAKTVGKRAFTIAAGGIGEVVVKLKKKARRRKKLKVTATATVAGGPTESTKLKLKR